jgi:transcription elongation GreA/GreB family factor
VNKHRIVQLIIAQISEDLGSLIASAKAAHKEATHEQSKAENKYDTRGLEASYLARGQSRQAIELEAARKEFESLVIDVALPDAPIEVGSLLCLENRKGKTHYFLGPKAGGIEVIFSGTPVIVITPNSPLGRQLIGKKQGETVSIPDTATGVKSRITQVW